jgi:hypothetical protein
MAYCVAAMTDIHHDPQLTIEVGSHYLPGLALNCDPPDLCLPYSLDYRPEPLRLASVFSLKDLGRLCIAA